MSNTFNKYYVIVTSDSESSLKYSKSNFNDFLPPLDINSFFFSILIMKIKLKILPALKIKWLSGRLRSNWLLVRVLLQSLKLSLCLLILWNLFVQIVFQQKLINY